MNNRNDNKSFISMHSFFHNIINLNLLILEDYFYFKTYSLLILIFRNEYKVDDFNLLHELRYSIIL